MTAPSAAVFHEGPRRADQDGEGRRLVLAPKLVRTMPGCDADPGTQCGEPDGGGLAMPRCLR